MRIGIISDTHGEIPAQVFDAFSEVDQILHAGDIGGFDIITTLETIAPVTAVYGNMDSFPVVTFFPEFRILNLSDTKILLTHKFRDQNSKPIIKFDQFSEDNFNVIVFGHTHAPCNRWIKSSLHFNPGSATSPRFGKRPSVGKLAIKKDGEIIPEIFYF